jgi:Asp-tRNA(Asn)/Glu-tRNA(Gln) amidotransferase A subunit family amidase
MRGSLLGVGTDIAGSIRIPALCCGTFGFKPTASRVPFGGGTFPGRAGSPGIQAVAGPLATSFRDLGLFLDCVIRAQPWNYDPTALAVPWRRDIHTKKVLTLGFIGEDPAYPLHPPVTRTLKAAAEKLKKAGHTVKQLNKIPSISEAAMLSFKLFELDNAKTAQKQIEEGGEPRIKSLKTSGPDFGDHRFTLEELFDLNIEQRKCVVDWHKIWMENGLDAVVMPGHAKTAGPHDTYGQPPYTVYWNLMDVSGVYVFGENASAD